jgi:hypothetical protein
VIAKHVLALYGAKVTAASRESGTLDIELEQETKNGAVYIHNSRPGTSRTAGKEFEKMYDAQASRAHGWRGGGQTVLTGVVPARAAGAGLSIDDKYLDSQHPYRLETYRSRGTVASGSPVQLRCYFVNRCVRIPLCQSRSHTHTRRDIRTHTRTHMHLYVHTNTHTLLLARLVRRLVGVRGRVLTARWLPGVTL